MTWDRTSTGGPQSPHMRPRWHMYIIEIIVAALHPGTRPPDRVCFGPKNAPCTHWCPADGAQLGIQHRQDLRRCKDPSVLAKCLPCLSNVVLRCADNRFVQLRVSGLFNAPALDGHILNVAAVLPLVLPHLHAEQYSVKNGQQQIHELRTSPYIASPIFFTQQKFPTSEKKAIKQSTTRETFEKPESQARPSSSLRFSLKCARLVFRGSLRQRTNLDSQAKTTSCAVESATRSQDPSWIAAGKTPLKVESGANARRRPPKALP